MRVLVTGAAGRMGSAVCRSLLGGGWDVVATDVRDRGDLGVKLHVVDLLDRRAVAGLVEGGVDALVHAGNHIDFNPPDAPLIFGENTMMNINVFQEAVDHGARKIVFASSIQMVFSVPRLPAYDFEEPPPCLPLDENAPVGPTNPYALSKACGEVLLQYYVRVFGVEGVALRLPWMIHMPDLPARVAAWRTESQFARQLVFAYMSFEDCGRLVAAILGTTLPGYRVYLPASRHNMLGRTAQELVEEFFPGVPLRRKISGESLVDISTIERETGWSPRD